LNIFQREFKTKNIRCAFFIPKVANVACNTITPYSYEWSPHIIFKSGRFHMSKMLNESLLEARAFLGG